MIMLIFVIKRIFLIVFLFGVFEFVVDVDKCVVLVGMIVLIFICEFVF